MNPFEQILAKANARLAKLEEKKAAVLEGRPARTGGIKGAAKLIEKTQRDAVKAREEFVQECLTKRDLILQHRVGRKWNRIQEVMEITKRAILEAREVLARDIDRAGISLQVQLVAHNLKSATAETDALNMERSLCRFNNFNDDVRVLILSLLESPRDLTEDDMKRIWQDNFSKSDIANLTRGTTIGQSIDFHAKNFLAVINDEAKNLADIQAAEAKFREGIKAVFGMYALGKIDVDAIIKFNI